MDKQHNHGKIVINTDGDWLFTLTVLIREQNANDLQNLLTDKGSRQPLMAVSIGDHCYEHGQWKVKYNVLLVRLCLKDLPLDYSLIKTVSISIFLFNLNVFECLS